MAANSTSASPFLTDPNKYLALYASGLTPLYTCVAAFTWALHDYLITFRREVQYVWPQRNRSVAKIMFFWVRYYTMALLLFDVIQIHLFRRPGITNDTVCVAMDSIIRIVGAISLWSIEITMQLRLYAIYNCSKKLAIINGILFAASIAGFMYVLVFNAQRRHAVIADAIHLPLPGCPSIHVGIEWIQWIPATVFEAILFGEALYSTLSSVARSAFRSKGARIPLSEILFRNHILWFGSIAFFLVMNNLMVVGKTKIPWFSYSPFHAAMGMVTTRMFIDLYKAMSDTRATTLGTWASTTANITMSTRMSYGQPNIANRSRGQTQSSSSTAHSDV